MVGSFIRMASDSPTSGVSDLDEPRVPLSRRLLPAMAVGASWVAAALPTSLGWQRCGWAALLHIPCPGCGMTRAIKLLAAGRLEASLRMHALAVPALAVGLSFAVATAWTTYERGTPLFFFKMRFGRATLASAMVVYAAALVLWVLRWVGFFGGPVPLG
jgi:hypothetical protein